MEINFGYDEMKNFILKGGKYKIANIKCFSPVPRSWSNNWQYTEDVNEESKDSYKDAAKALDNIINTRTLL